MTEDIREKLNKLKALAERGVGGEAINAQAFLEKLLNKYSIKEADLLEETIKEYEFYCSGLFGTKLLHQIVYAVNPTIRICVYKFKRKDCKTRFLHCTQAEYLEICEMYEFYRYHLDKGIEMYYEAFIQAEEIFPDYSKYPDAAKDSIGELSEEDLKMLALARNIEKHERRLQIEAKKNN